MSNKKKEWLSPEIHPNVGTPITLLLDNNETGKSVTRKGTWNRTHWVLRKAGLEGTVSIPGNLKVIGWSK